MQRLNDLRREVAEVQRELDTFRSGRHRQRNFAVQTLEDLLLRVRTQDVVDFSLAKMPDASAHCTQYTVRLVLRGP